MWRTSLHLRKQVSALRRKVTASHAEQRHYMPRMWHTLRHRPCCLPQLWRTEQKSRSKQGERPDTTFTPKAGPQQNPLYRRG